MNKFPFSLYILVLVACFSCKNSTKVLLDKKTNSPQVQFAIDKIEQVLMKPGVIIRNGKNIFLSFKLDTVSIVQQGYSIQILSNGKIQILGGDTLGLMYGGLELAEQISLNKKLPEESSEGQPYIEKRGLKFNIPLDARTPSYDDTGDAAQRNILEMWNMEFWKEYLDKMAIHRYNTLTLWNPHPFPSMIKLTDYPDVELDGIYVTTLKPGGIENEWGEPQLVADTVMDNLKKVKEISIEQKIDFWKEVMQYAKNRGIDIYYITWNICPNSVARPVKSFTKTYGIKVVDEEPGKYGVSHQINNPKTISYLRAAVKEFLLTYPLVKGIGVTAGENMPHEWDYNKEEWLWNAYGEGILDAKREQPHRKVDFIHRVWYSDLDEIMKYWKQYPDKFELSFKYAKARLYSSPNIVFDDSQIEAMKPFNLQSWWNLRNDDIYVFRWGDPDYVRSFLTNFDLPYTAGYHMGSDGYVWGREFSARKTSGASRELEITKHWYNFMLWGRLGYNPKLSKEFFIHKLADRHPHVDAEQLYTTWQAVSKILPEVNKFHWRSWDHMFTFESCLSRFDGFRHVLSFVDNPTMDGQNILNPKDYVQSLIKGNDTNTFKNPKQVSGIIEEYALQTFAGIKDLKSANQSLEMEYLLADFEAMSWLGLYYSEKINSAVEIAWYQQTKENEHKDRALKYMEKALYNWKKYGEIYNKYYYPQMLARPGNLDCDLLFKEVEKDLEMIKNL